MIESESGQKYPQWLRALDVVLGLCSLLLGLWILVDLSLVPLASLFIMSFALIALGLARMAKAFAIGTMNILSRVLNILAGIIAIIMSVLVFVFSSLAIELLILLVAVGLLFVGVVRMAIGLLEEEMVGWGRILHFLVGLITISVALFALLFPAFGFLTLAVVLAIGFVSNGFARIVAGITGKLR